MAIVSLLLVCVAGILAVPAAVLLGEVLAALAWPRGRRSAGPENVVRPRIAVLVPAHNEGTGLLPTLQDIAAQLAPGDRLLVVADNCTDGTATVAATAGAEVVVRTDLDRVGKGYALDHGLRHLRADPPAVVVVIDADCRLSEGALDHLARTSAATGRPAQALYLMLAPERSAINHQVAAFAWRVKNWVRPLGLSALGLPCHLLGTGMALPWEAVRAVELASGEIVEDLKLGLDLAVAGRAPLFCPSAVVTSAFPLSRAGAETQRERWEHGHIGLIASAVPHLILSALKRRDPRLLALALDLAVPPVALLMLLLAGTLGLTGLAALAGVSPLAFHVTLAAFVAFTLAILLAWWTRGRTILPLGSILLLPAYVWGKCRLYARLLKGERASQWVRTDRH